MKPIPFLLLLGCILPVFLQAGARKPNFVYVMVDDAGYGDFSCFGQKKFKTPSVDRMAKEGMKLTDFYSSSTVCAPSRCSLMTGMHTGHALVRGNKEVKPEGQSPLAEKCPNDPRSPQKSGLRFGHVRKVGLGRPRFGR